MIGRYPRVVMITVPAYRRPLDDDRWWSVSCDRCYAPCWIDGPTREVVMTGAVVRVWCDVCHAITRG